MSRKNSIPSLHEIKCSSCKKSLIGKSKFSMVPLEDGWRAYICEDCKPAFNEHQKKMGGSFRL